MKRFTAYLAILLILLMVYQIYDLFKVKEGHKIDRMWHKNEKIGPDGVKHSHPLAWATNKYGHGKVDYITDSGLQIPNSVENAESNGYTCLPLDSYASHQELIQKETPNSPLGNGLDKDGTYTTSTSDGTVVTYDELTKTWETTLNSSDYTYPDNRKKFWDKVDEFSSSYSTNSQKYTLWNIVSNIIGIKLSDPAYDYHIDKALKEKSLGFYAEKTGKPISTICNHYHSANTQLNEILDDENNYHTGSNDSLKSFNPPPCEESDLDTNCIYGWKENSLSEWKNIHNNIKDKIDKKCQ